MTCKLFFYGRRGRGAFGELIVLLITCIWKDYLFHFLAWFPPVKKPFAGLDQKVLWNITARRKNCSEPSNLWRNNSKNLLRIIYYPSHEIFRYQKLPHAFQTFKTIMRSNSSLVHLCKTQNSKTFWTSLIWYFYCPAIYS